MSHPPHFANAEVMFLDPVSVDRDWDGRIGLFFPAKRDAYSALISARGQNEPIKVRKNGTRAKFAWTLVAGLHRLEACALLGISVTAIEVRGDENDLADIQASENIDRRELAPLEKAMFVHAVAEAAKMRAFEEHGVNNNKALAAKAKAAKVQHKELVVADAEAEAAAVNLTAAYGWSAETAEACGLSQEHLRRSLRIHRCIAAPFRHLLDDQANEKKGFKDHPVAQVASQLLKLCPIGHDMRQAAIEWLLDNPECQSVEEALVAVGLHEGKGNQLAPADQRFSKAISFFSPSKFPRREQLALFQSPTFQDLLPKEVRDLLKPLRCDTVQEGGRNAA